MTIEEIIKLEENQLRLEELEGICEKISPFVGAGISKGCGLSTWDELLENLTNHYLGKSYRSLKKKCKDKLEIVDQIIKVVDGNESAVMRKVCDMVEIAQRNGKRTVNPELLVNNFSQIIITTNYDTILEDVMEELDGVKAEIMLPVMRTQTTRAILDNSRCIVKIHGSIKEDTSMIFSNSQYDEAYGERGKVDFTKPIPQALLQIFSGQRVLFVGCSLEEDRTMEVLREVIQLNSRISHYAIIELPEDSVKKRELCIRLDKVGIQPIFYPEGKHEAIELILEYVSNGKKKQI